MRGKNSSGFTLIELMIVVAIIAVLASIAIPAYSAYRVRAAENACLAEMANYTRFSLATLYNEKTPGGAPQSACDSADDAVKIGEDISALPRSPGQRTVKCNMQNGNCVLE